MDTRILLGQIEPLLMSIWKDGYRYQKAGVILSDFSPAKVQQPDLFTEEDRVHQQKLMQLIDKLNRQKPQQIQFASAGLQPEKWAMKRERLSPRYTTDINELMQVY
jgi:DNA polymerase V